MSNTRTLSTLTLVGGLALASALPLSATAASADQALSQAESAIEDAKANNWIWRDTEKVYKAAKAAAEKGDTDKAIKLANKAREHAELAIKQYHLEQKMDRSEQVAEAIDS